MMTGFEGENWFVFLTLTSVPERTWPEIMTGFTRFVEYLRLTQPELQYVAVKEEGKDTGMKHLHIIFRSWIWHNYDDMVAHWKKLTGAHGVYIKRKPTEALAGYAAKYVGKGLISARKAVTYSKLWPKLPVNKAWIPMGHESSTLFEPPAWMEDDSGKLLENVPPQCYHVGEITLLTLHTIAWLKSIQGLYWLPPPVPSVS